jgi:alcohol dehydrogenase
MRISEYYEFSNQAKLVSGTNSLENIPYELDCYDSRKPLVITEKNASGRGGIVKKFIKAFYDSAVTLGGIYDEVRSHAGVSLAAEAARLFGERGCDSFIALGNGPVTNLAKAANILVSENTDSLLAYFGGSPIRSRLKPLVHVPTCCATGTEVTAGAIIENRKIASDLLFPDVVVIDPRMTRACSSRCAAESGAIALAQAFGALTGEVHNPMTDAYARSALGLLSGYLARGVRRSKNKKAGVALANASVMASIASSNAGPGMTEMLADELERRTGLSRGIFMRILLPGVIAFMTKKKMIRDELFLAVAGPDAYAATPASERPLKGADMLFNLLGGLKGILPESLKQLNVQKHLLEDAAGAVGKASSKRFLGADCLAVLEQAWG